MTTPDSLPAVSVHDGIEEWMAAALTGGLTSDEEQRSFADHLAGCAHCRELFAEETAMSQTMQNAFDTVRPLPGFERRLAAAFRQRRQSAFGERLRVFSHHLAGRPLVRVSGAAAGLLILIWLGANLTHELPGGEGSGFAVPQVATTLDNPPVLGESVRELVVPADSSRFPANARRGDRSQSGVAGGMVAAAPAAAAADEDAPHEHGIEFGFQGNLQKVAEAKASRTLLARSPVPATAPASSAAPPPPEPAASPRPAAATDTRKLIRNANVALEVAAFDPAVDALGAAASQVGGGYVATVDSSRLPNGKRRGALVIKVLPERLDAFLARLHELGEIKSQNVSAEDVSKAYFDTDARLRNARRMEDRLLKILDDAKGKLSEILQVEKELGRVREDIEKMQGELQLYDSLVRYATVTVDVYEKDLQQPATFLLRQTGELSLLSGDVEKTYDDARHAAEDAHAQIVTSELVRGADHRVTATLRLLLAPETAASVIDRLKALARVHGFQMRAERVAQNGDAADTGTDAGKLERGPVTLDLSITPDDEPPVQQTSIEVLCADVDQRLREVRQAAADAGAQVRSSTFEQSTDGGETASLVFRLPMRAYPGFSGRIRSLGEVKELNVHRQDQPGVVALARPAGAGDGDAPAEISLRLYSQGRVVDAESGVAATLRRTLGQGAGALMWSLRMMGVALAFLAPWAGAIALLVWLRRLLKRRQFEAGKRTPT